MRIDAASIDDAHAAARDGGDDEAAIFAARRKQLDRVPRAHFESSGEARTENDGVRVIAKIAEAPGDKLLGQVGGLEMEGRLDAEEVTVAFSNPARALSVPRRTGEQAATSANWRLMRMISRAFVIPLR